MAMSLTAQQLSLLGSCLETHFFYRDDVDGPDVEKIIAQVKGIPYSSPGQDFFDISDQKTGYSVKTLKQGHTTKIVRVLDKRMSSEKKETILEGDTPEMMGAAVLSFLKETLDQALEDFQVEEARWAILLRDLRRGRCAFRYLEADLKKVIYGLVGMNEQSLLTWRMHMNFKENRIESVVACLDRKRLIAFLPYHKQINIYLDIPPNVPRGEFTIVKKELIGPAVSTVSTATGAINAANEVFGFDEEEE